jgi:hypothetical protein
MLGLRGVVRTSHTILNGRSYQNLDAFAPFDEWTAVATESVNGQNGLADGL